MPGSCYIKQPGVILWSTYHAVGEFWLKPSQGVTPKWGSLLGAMVLKMAAAVFPEFGGIGKEIMIHLS